MRDGPDRLTFAAPWGALLKFTTVLLVVVLSGTAIAGLIVLPAAAPRICRWIIGGMPTLIIVATVPFVVRGYTVDPGELRVHRMFWETRISWIGLKTIEHDPGAMRRSIRLFGNGGGFVFAGWFRNGQLGLYRAFVNDPNRAVVLRFPARTVVVSPDNPAEFAAAVTKQLKSIGLME